MLNFDKVKKVDPEVWEAPALHQEKSLSGTGGPSTAKNNIN